MTPTQLIYRAWQNTSRPIIYHTHDSKGNDLAVDCEFVDPVMVNGYDPEWTGECTICGAKSHGGIPNRKMFSANYADWDKHKNPQSDHVCAACAMTMLRNTAPGARLMALSRYSFCAGEALEILNRMQLRERMLNPPDPPFVMVAAVSQKKHLAIKSRVAYSRDSFICMLEEEPIEVDRQRAKDIIDVIEALRGIGFTKDEIAAGRIRYDRIKDFKLNAYDKINHLLRPCMGTRLFCLCLFVAQKTNEEEAICFLDLTRKTNPQQPERSSSTQSIKVGMSREAPADTTCGTRSSDLPAGLPNGQTTLAGF